MELELTKSKYKVKLKEYLTGRDLEKLQGVMMGDMKLDARKPDKAEVTGSTVINYNHALIEVAVVDPKLEEILDLPAEDYQELLKVITEELVQGKEVTGK